MNRGQAFLIALLCVVALLSFLILLPFVEYVFAAVLLAYLLYPLHQRLEPRVGPIVSPILLIVASLVVVIVPLLYVISVLVSDLRALAGGDIGLEASTIETRMFEATGVEIDVTELLSLAGEELVEVLFGGVTGVFTAALQVSLGLALALFLLFYLLRDGAEFVAWLEALSPLPDRVTERLFTKIDHTTWGVVIGHLSVSVLQAVIAGVGLYLVGIPNVVFWTFVMALLALLPLIGAFLVWGPAAVYLVVIGDVTAGVLLAVYGVAVVSMVDNYARPLVIDQQARLNPGVILIGVFGGIYSIGFTGLFIGPIALGVLVATLETFREDYDRV